MQITEERRIELLKLQGIWDEPEVVEETRPWGTRTPKAKRIVAPPLRYDVPLDFSKPILKGARRNYERYERNVAKRKIKLMIVAQHKRRIELRKQSFYLFKLPDIRTKIAPFEPRTVSFYKPQKKNLLTVPLN